MLSGNKTKVIPLWLKPGMPMCFIMEGNMFLLYEPPFLGQLLTDSSSCKGEWCQKWWDKESGSYIIRWPDSLAVCFSCSEACPQTQHNLMKGHSFQPPKEENFTWRYLTSVCECELKLDCCCKAALPLVKWQGIHLVGWFVWREKYFQICMFVEL